METKSEPYSEEIGPSLETLRLDIVKRLGATDENYSRNSVVNFCLYSPNKIFNRIRKANYINLGMVLKLSTNHFPHKIIF